MTSYEEDVIERIYRHIEQCKLIINNDSDPEYITICRHDYNLLTDILGETNGIQ